MYFLIKLLEGQSSSKVKWMLYEDLLSWCPCLPVPLTNIICSRKTHTLSRNPESHYINSFSQSQTLSGGESILLETPNLEELHGLQSSSYSYRIWTRVKNLALSTMPFPLYHTTHHLQENQDHGVCNHLHNSWEKVPLLILKDVLKTESFIKSSCSFVKYHLPLNIGFSMTRAVCPRSRWMKSIPGRDAVSSKRNESGFMQPPA